MIFATPSASMMSALDGSASLTEKYSSHSPTRSPWTGTAIVMLVCPGRKVSVPDVAAKSPPASVAVPSRTL
jgi:hypothetical protein